LLRRRTLFVIGAGTGAGMNMPVGDQLSSTIAGYVNVTFEEGRRKTGDEMLMDRLGRIGKTRGIDRNALFAAGRAIAAGIRNFRSIDNYIFSQGKDEKVTLVAKLAIVRAIVDAELRSYLWVEEGTRKFRSEDAVDKSWYPDLSYLLAEGLVVDSTLDTIFDKLRIINFNYDRCIDQYLFHRLQRMFYAKDAAYFSELLAKKLYIIHPYGSLGPMPWKDQANGVRFGGNHEYPEDMEKMAERILTYNEQIQDEAIVHGIDGMIDWAEQFIFLGFHFHQQNMDLLTGKREAPSRPSEQVGVYATHVGRSTAEKDIIAMQVSQMLHGRFMGSQSLKEDIDCKKLFKDYGTTFAR
jgi:hypothetical protein